MTNGWTDIANADVILAMGGNPAENHPVGFRFVMEAKRRRGAKLVAVDPRFQRTAAVADHFVQTRAGTDIAFLGGLINYALQTGHVQVDYVKLHTNAPFIVKEGYSFDAKTGLFSGWDKDKKQYDTSSWQYEVDAQGNAQVDPTLQHPRSVFQLMKVFYSRYTPEKVSEVCGCDAEAFKKAAEIITSTYPANRAGTIMYALGWTHQSQPVRLHASSPPARGFEVRQTGELELGLYLRPHGARAGRRPGRLRDEPRLQRTQLPEDGVRPVAAQVARGCRKLRDGDDLVLEAGDFGAGGQENRGRQNRSLPPARGQLRREVRIVHQLLALGAVEIQGPRCPRPGEAGPGDYRAHLHEGPGALQGRGRNLP